MFRPVRCLSRCQRRGFSTTVSSRKLDVYRQHDRSSTIAWQAQHRRFSGRSVKTLTADRSHLSYPGERPLEDKTIGQLFEEASKRWPDRDCLISHRQNLRLTFGEVRRRADKLSAGLKKLGLRKGDRLGIWAPNDVEWYITSIAAARLGLIVAGINPAYQQPELDYCLRKVEVSAVVAPEGFKTQRYAEMLLKAKESCPSLKHIIIYSDRGITGTRRFADVESSASPAEVQGIAAELDGISGYDGANIQFTSGTTGAPKATLLCHRALYNNARQTAARGEFQEGQKSCLNVPFFHAFGLVVGQLGHLHCGATLVLNDRSFNPVSALQAIVGEKCSAAFGTPTMWVNLLDAQDRLNLPISLRVGFLGGSPASPELFRRIKEYFRLEKPKSIYGLTEVTCTTFQSLPGEAPELTETTVGHLSDDVEVMVVDEKGSPVPFETPGELWVRGYTTMLGYWGDEENTKKTLTDDGWLKTGDQFILRADGYGKVVGRLKDMVIRGGENIFPREVEDFFLTHPKVLEVYVVGVYDEVYGEELCACVRPRDGTKITKEELKDYCRGKIAHFKIPRYIEFMDEFPKTTSGKVQKFLVKEELERKKLVPSRPK